MTRKDIRHRMSVKHEEYISGLFGGTHSAGSGNQAAAPMDGRQDRHRQEYAFAWDGKATLSPSISVTRKMWEKACEQSWGEQPMLALRFYDTDRLEPGLDLAVIELHLLAEILERVNGRDSTT